MGLLERLQQNLNKQSAQNRTVDVNVDVSTLRDKLDFEELKDSIQIEHSQADLKWKKRYYQLRTIWAWLTIILLGLNLWFTLWLVRSVGMGTLDFSEYKTFLNIIAGEIIINVLGLVAIVMHFLFPNKSKRNG